MAFNKDAWLVASHGIFRVMGSLLAFGIHSSRRGSHHALRDSLTPCRFPGRLAGTSIASMILNTILFYWSNPVLSWLSPTRYHLLNFLLQRLNFRSFVSHVSRFFQRFPGPSGTRLQNVTSVFVRPHLDALTLPRSDEIIYIRCIRGQNEGKRGAFMLPPQAYYYYSL